MLMQLVVVKNGKNLKSVNILKEENQKEENQKKEILKEENQKRNILSVENHLKDNLLLST